MKVALAEMNDLASGTSIASTKLIHGGLRYLEYFDFRLVRESLKERDILLRNMPHLAWPLCFVLPLHQNMQFEESTPTSKLLSIVFPWMIGKRPAWLIRMGLMLYDSFAGSSILPKMSEINLQIDQAGETLRNKFKTAFEYSDCWVDDSRLVAMNARSASEFGALILSRTKVISCQSMNGVWQIEITTGSGKQTILSKTLINATGPWVDDFLKKAIGNKSQNHIRLVQGSHIVTKKLYDHEKCYIFQSSDSRIIFLIPYENNFSLIGTTDLDYKEISETPNCSTSETEYLLNEISEYLRYPLTEEHIVWKFSGVRPLIDDSSYSAATVTRDYKLRVDTDLWSTSVKCFWREIDHLSKIIRVCSR